MAPNCLSRSLMTGMQSFSRFALDSGSTWSSTAQIGGFVMKQMVACCESTFRDEANDHTILTNLWFVVR